jgi:hypothetical protein
MREINFGSDSCSPSYAASGEGQPSQINPSPHFSSEESGLSAGGDAALVSKPANGAYCETGAPVIALNSRADLLDNQGHLKGVTQRLTCSIEKLPMNSLGLADKCELGVPGVKDAGEQAAKGKRGNASPTASCLSGFQIICFNYPRPLYERVMDFLDERENPPDDLVGYPDPAENPRFA